MRQHSLDVQQRELAKEFTLEKGPYRLVDENAFDINEIRLKKDETHARKLVRDLFHRMINLF
jgi:hypothetical protein